MDEQTSSPNSILQEIAEESERGFFPVPSASSREMGHGLG